MKIAIGGLSIESCTFSPLLSQEEDFKILGEMNCLRVILFYIPTRMFPRSPCFLPEPYREDQLKPVSMIV